MRALKVERLKGKNLTFRIENRRYIGSKSRLLDEIFRAIPSSLQKGHFLDLFGGTGVVAARALKTFDSVSINDHLYSNYVVYQGFFGKGRYSIKKLTEVQQSIKHLVREEPNYFSSEFGDRYFSRDDATIIGQIREYIDEELASLTTRERSIVLASLIYSVDKCARTVGHYETFLHSEKLRNRFNFQLIQPFKGLSAAIYREDANSLVRRLSADVVYIDPPYNSRQYSRFYHVLETLTKWEKPTLSGVARKPPPENSSEYCKTAAPKIFDDLIQNINAKIIVVSYNNTYKSRSTSSRNKIQHEEIMASLSDRGKVQVRSLPIAHFNAGKSSLDNHMEHIFVCKTR